MADNTLEKPVEETILTDSQSVTSTIKDQEPRLEGKGPAHYKKPKILISIIAALLILIILAGGGFLGIRLYEAQSLSQAKSDLQQGNWAAAETATEKALALQQTGLLDNPLDLIMVRGEARYQQKKYDLATADFNMIKASRPADAMPYLYQSMMLYDQGKLDEAVKMGGEALTRDNKLAFPFAIQAYQAYRTNQLTDALNYAAAAIQRDPKMELAYRVRGSVLTWQYDLDAAQADLKRALELLPNQPETLAMQAYIHFIRYEDKDLKAIADAEVKYGKDSAPALWVQAMLALQNHDNDDATKLMDRAIQLDGSRPEYYLFRIYSFYKTDQEKQALLDFDKALELNPDFVPAIAGKARYLFEVYKKVDIEAESKRVLTLAPKANLSYLMLADQYIRERDYPKALEAAETALKAQPGPVAALLTRAAIYMAQHEYDKAAADCSAAAKASSYDVTGLIGLSGAQIGKRAFDEAIKTLDQAAKVDAQSISVHGHRAMVYLAQEELSKARKEVDEALKLDAGNSDILLIRAMISTRENNNLSALSDINHVGELYPEDPRVMGLRAAVMAANNDTKAAMAELDKAEKIDKKLTDIYLTRGLVYMGQNDPTNVIAQAKKAIDLDPMNGSAYAMLGDAELQKQKTQEGIDHLKKSIELDPSQRYPYYALGIAQWNQGDVESALVNLNKMVGMKGKLDMKLVTDARQVISFLKDVPVAVNGLRTVKDDRLNYSVTYPTSWVPKPSAQDNKNGLQFMLARVDEKDSSLFQVQVIQLLDLDIHSAITVDMVSAGMLSGMAKLCYDFKPVAHEVFAGQGTQGLAETYICTFQDKNQQFFTLKEKIYLFVSDKSYVVLQYYSVPENFEKDVKAADEIAASFSFIH